MTTTSSWNGFLLFRALRGIFGLLAVRLPKALLAMHREIDRMVRRRPAEIATDLRQNALGNKTQIQGSFTGTAIVTQSEPPAQWPEDVPVGLSKAHLKPILVGLLEPASVVRKFDGIALSAWPNSTQVNHYLVDCRAANRDETEAMCEIANRVIAAVKQDEDIRSRWDFLTACGLVVRLGVYQDPGIDSLSLQIVRSSEAEANLRASLSKS